MPRRSATGSTPSWDRLFELALPQAGYFTLAQAREASFSPPLLQYHVREGLLQRAGRGVFRLTRYPPGENEDLVIAWLWSDRQGVFSHETALLLHGLSDALPEQKHLTVPAAWARRRLRVPGGVDLHFAAVADSDITWSGPVPVTGVRRTIRDCAAAHVAPDLIEQAVKQAAARGLIARDTVRELRREIAPPTGVPDRPERGSSRNSR